MNEALVAAAGSEATLTFVRGDESEQRLSWAEVLERARLTAAGLAGRGVTAGDRVALILPTSLDFVAAFFGALLAGAVPVPLYPPARLGRLDEYHDSTSRLLTAAGARLLVTDRSVRNLLGRVLATAGTELGCVTVADLDRSAAGPAPMPEVGPGDLALVQFSSGTTRDPRPVALTQAALVAQCAALKQLIDDVLGPAAPAGLRTGVSWLPLYHDMGLIGSLLGAVTHPGSLVLIPPERFLVRPALWLRAIARHRAQVSPAPAFAFGLAARRVREMEMAGCDLSCWRLAICGAEPVPAAVLERFARRFAPHGFRRQALAPAYGLAEAALAVTCTHGGGPATCAVDGAALSVGRPVAPGVHSVTAAGEPLAEVEVEIRDDRGRPLPESVYGHIHVRGPGLMIGYLGQREATRAVLRGGWLATGDLGFRQDGRLWVAGRARDVIILRGANRLPEEFEEAVAGSPGVRPGRAVAVGIMPEGADGEGLLMLVEHARGAAAGAGELAERLQREVRRRTGIAPHAVVVLAPGTLPLTSSGKLRRAEARRRHLAGELSGPGSAGPVALAGHLMRSAAGFVRWRLGRT
ncbi:MAG: AMP-binding protein [Candidatus Krumholzibacteriia bacterium]